MFFKAVLAILWKDFQIEFRTKETIVPIAVLALLVIVVFNFAALPTTSEIPVLAPGILWISLSFAGVLGLSRIFEMEKEQGTIEGLLLAPIPKDVIFFGKFLSIYFFMIAVELFLLPIFCILYNLPLVEPSLWGISLLGTFGFCAVGTIFSAMAVNTRAKELTIPILFFPTVIPVIIAAVEVTGAILSNNQTFDFGRWILLLVAFDLTFIVLSAITFKYVISD